MWKTRNRILHHTQENISKQLQHEHLNECIDEIFTRKPHPRLMSHCDNAYFKKYPTDTLRNMRLQRKTNWIAGANLIIAKYERTTSEQSMRFRSFFQWDPG